MVAVITGDIINSRTRTNQDAWMKPLKRIFSKYGKMPATWEIFRGDSFQLEISDPSQALLTALEIKATIKSQEGLDIRMSIGIGEKNYTAKRITESNGEAFIASGEAFNQLPQQKRTLVIVTPWAAFNEAIDVMLKLAAIPMDKWTPLMAEIVKASIENPNSIQSDIASKLKRKSQSDISTGRRRAAYEEIMAMENYFSSYIHKMTLT